ncbi:MAG: protein kinase [Myxococcota bacterium]
MTAQSQPFGRYTLEEKLATGGMGEVYLAVDHGAGGAVAGYEKVVVIKRILPQLATQSEFVSMFLREAALVAQLTHQNIVQLHDHGSIDGHYFMAMEYVQGLDLRAFLDHHRRKETPVPMGEALYVGGALARALDYAHRKKGRNGASLNIIHRDVSPQNVLLSLEGDVKLTDFGVVKAVLKMPLPEGGDSGLVGKLAYVSPEQAEGLEIDQRSDVFSLGIVLHELTTLHHPFARKGEKGLALLDLIRRAELPPMTTLRADLPAGFEEIVRRCLARNVDERFASARQVLDALEGIRVRDFPHVRETTLADYLERALPPVETPAVVARITGQFPAAKETPPAAHTPSDSGKQRTPSDSGKQGGTREAANPVARAISDDARSPGWMNAVDESLTSSLPPTQEMTLPPDAGLPPGEPLVSRAHHADDDVEAPGGAGRAVVMTLAAVLLAGGAAYGAYWYQRHATQPLGPMMSAPGAPQIPDPPSVRIRPRTPPPSRPSRNEERGGSNAAPSGTQPETQERAPVAQPETSERAPGTAVTTWQIAPDAPALPASKGLSYVATREVEVRVDGTALGNAPKGELGTVPPSFDVVFRFGPDSTITVKVTDHPTRMLNVSSSEPVRMGTADGATAVRRTFNVELGTWGERITVSGPDYALSLAVK